MLIEFSAENFRSIKQEARLSLVADPEKERSDTHSVVPFLRKAGSHPSRLLRSAAIYGANAAGKTNLLRALSMMRRIVLNSYRDDDAIPVTPFLFDSTSRDQPTTFEIIFLSDGVRYQYGFSANPKMVVAEWLYAWPSGRVQRWLHRQDGEWTFGDKLIGARHVWRRATRPDALYLSTAVALNSNQLKPIVDWFRDIVPIGVSDTRENTVSMRRLRESGQSGLIEFLQTADLAIADLRVSQEEFRPDTRPADLQSTVPDQATTGRAAGTVGQVWLSHDIGDGKPTDLTLQEESDGTRTMFALAGPWLESLHEGHLVMIDDLHDSLHPKLVQFLIDQFHDPTINRRGAQLIFSTHDTSILSQEVFRRDQIWFCERNKRQETKLFPLTDFSPRTGVENLGRSYLAGRYGAVPYIASKATSIRR